MYWQVNFQRNNNIPTYFSNIIYFNDREFRVYINKLHANFINKPWRSSVIFIALCNILKHYIVFLYVNTTYYNILYFIF